MRPTVPVVGAPMRRSHCSEDRSVNTGPLQLIQSARGDGMKHVDRSRRQVLRMGALVGGSLFAGRSVLAAEADARKLGTPLGPFGERSPFERATRFLRESKTPETGSSFT